jgi:hypothetical protein
MNWPSLTKWREIDTRYERPLTSALFASWLWWCFWGLLLDGGVRKTGCTIALVGFWAGVVLILLRRPHSPTRVDLIYIRFAVTPVVLSTVLIYPNNGGWLLEVVHQLATR